MRWESMKKRLFSLLFLILIMLTGCSARANVPQEPEVIQEEPAAVEVTEATAEVAEPAEADAVEEEPEAETEEAEPEVAAESDSDGDAESDDSSPDPDEETKSEEAEEAEAKKTESDTSEEAKAPEETKSEQPDSEESKAEPTDETKPSSTQTQPQSSSVPNDGGHNYYKNVPADGVAAAEAIASQIASSIMSEPSFTTDLQRVSAAAAIVSAYCDGCVYGNDESKYYRSPYGVFVAGVYTCAGSTRALGRVLDYMGYSWQHHNENQNSHQWCIVTMDGQTGFADGMGGFAGYGEMTNGMTLPDGSQIYFAE